MGGTSCRPPIRRSKIGKSNSGVSLRLHSNLLYQKFVTMANRTRGARGVSELNCTLHKSPATTSLHSATPKKNVLSFLEKISRAQNQNCKESFSARLRASTRGRRATHFRSRAKNGGGEGEEIFCPLAFQTPNYFALTKIYLLNILCAYIRQPDLDR